MLLVKKDDKGKDFLKDENLDKINGGKNTTYNKEVQGNGNIVGVNANFEQMLGAIDKMNKSGKLDYLKKK